MSIITGGKRKAVESVAEGDTAEGPPADGRRRKGEKSDGGGLRFQNQLRSMMFGFGDSAKPLPQSMELMEELVVDYIQQILAKAKPPAASLRPASKPPPSCWLLRNREASPYFLLNPSPLFVHAFPPLDSIPAPAIVTPHPNPSERMDTANMGGGCWSPPHPSFLPPLLCEQR